MQAYVEQNCTIEHNGRTFTSGGAVVTPDYIVAYVGDFLLSGLTGQRDTRKLTDWHGNVIGTCTLASSWRINSYISDRMYQIYATVDGRRYTGRGCGEGMVCKLRPCK